MGSRYVYMFLLVFLFFFQSAVADDANIFTGSNASAVICEALTMGGAGSDVSIHINEFRDEDQVATASSTISAEVDNLKFDKDHNYWKATLLLKSGGRNLAPISVSGTYDVMASIPVLKRQVHSGEVITADDVIYDKQSSRHLRKDTVTDSKDLIGKSPKNVISQGRPIREAEISNPAVLLKGTHITMVYRSRNLEIRTTGEALDSGAKGDVVRIRNLSSKSIVEGVVENGDRVHVTSPDSDSAEAM